MIYLASRSHQKYLDKLCEIARRPVPHHLVSITGGLAFLHAISERTQTLTLVDSDPEVNDYASAMIEVFICCTTRAEFFGLLTGKSLDSSEDQIVHFLERAYHDRNRILASLSTPSRMIIERWYGQGTFDVTTGELSVEDKKVIFSGFDLTPQHFNWHTERDCFATEISYRLLSQNLARLSPRLLTMPLEKFPFEDCPVDTLVLASNTDSPLFTSNDAVLRAVEQRGTGRCFYVSRTRDYSSRLPKQSQARREPDMSMACIGVGCPRDYESSIQTALSGTWEFLSTETYLQENFYDQEFILFFISSKRSQAEKIIENLTQRLPIHQRVGFISDQALPIDKIIPELTLSYDASDCISVPLPAGFILAGQLFELKCRTPYRMTSAESNGIRASSTAQQF